MKRELTRLTNFAQIKEALAYIDGHLCETVTLPELARRAYFSQYYFHRLFTAVVGKTLAAYVRDRRLSAACLRLYATDDAVLDIALDCGFASAQAFSRTFRAAYGLSPREYRQGGYVPSPVSVEELIKKFTNRLRGGMDVNPRIIQKDALHIAGVSGDGNRTAEVWETFSKLDGTCPAENKVSENGYEIRFYDGNACTVHAGVEVRGASAAPPYKLVSLPASAYAAFDVYVADGYDSENDAMSEWLASNGVWRERLIDGRNACVEYYDARFQGEQAESIVEIWIPIERCEGTKA